MMHSCVMCSCVMCSPVRFVYFMVASLRKVGSTSLPVLLGVPETVLAKINNLSPTTYYTLTYSITRTLRIAFERSSGRCRHRRQREAPHTEASHYYVLPEVCRTGYPMPAQRQAEVLGTPTHAQLPVPSTINRHYAPSEALGAGNASSLPSLVLRSMLKQRRILMRMH